MSSLFIWGSRSVPPAISVVSPPRSARSFSQSMAILTTPTFDAASRHRREPCCRGDGLSQHWQLCLSADFCVAAHALVPYSGDMTTTPLNRADVIARLQGAEQQIARLGVRRLALFGSVLRNEARSGSDVDLLIEFDPTHKTFDNFLEVSELLERLLDRPIDLVTTEALSPYIGPHILAEAEDVVRAA